jgi:membrane protein YqaA with SNARE-associated domain
MKLLHPLTRPLRKIYDWMLSFAGRPSAEPVLFGISFIESSFFPIPPDPLLMAMGAARPARAIRYAVITTVASVLGALLGYAIGALLMDTVGAWLLDLYDPERHAWSKVEAWYAKYGAMALLLAAITPIPYKVFTIASGALALPLIPFVGWSLLGRGFRFGTEGVLLRFYGAPILAWVEKWFDWVAIGFTVLLVGGFVALRWLG